MKRAFFLVTSLIFLNGCSSIVKQQEETDRIHSQYLVKLYENYEGQFLSKNEPHAVLSGFPYPGYDSLKTGGLVPFKVDNVGVKSLLKMRDELPHPLNWANRPHYGWYTPDQAILHLRVKPGSYAVEVWGGAYTPKVTLIPNVKMEAGKAYLIYSRNVGGSRKLSVNEYQVDGKFEASENEHYLIGKPVSDEVVYGNEK